MTGRNWARVTVLTAVAALLASACGGSSGLTVTGSEATAPPVATAAPEPTSVPEPTTAPVATTAPLPTPSPVPAPTSTPVPAPTATPEPQGDPLNTDGDLWTLDWGRVNPTYLPNTGPASDPFFHIHTSNEQDGFYLSFEMFTIWGAAWTGQTGTFEISCLDVSNDTGICVHFDPDGPGPSGDIAADFGATGEMTIHQLDDAGYSIEVHSLMFTDGTTFAPFEMFG